MSHTITLESPQQAHEVWTRAWQWVKGRTLQGRRVTLTLQDETRSLEQNDLMWAILSDFSRQLLWPVDGQMVKMDPEEWKDVLSAAFRKEKVRLAMGLDGGVVMLGMRTRKMSKKTMSEFIEFLQATAALRGVVLEGDK